MGFTGFHNYRSYRSSVEYAWALWSFLVPWPLWPFGPVEIFWALGPWVPWALGLFGPLAPWALWTLGPLQTGSGFLFLLRGETPPDWRMAWRVRFGLPFRTPPPPYTPSMQC